jgi:excisionase family DNA binding protein
MLQVKPSLVYRLAREHRIPTVRLGERYIRFERAAVERWIGERSGT